MGVGSPSELIEYGVVRLLATHRSTRCGPLFQQHQPGKERGPRVCLECRIQQGWRILPYPAPASARHAAVGAEMMRNPQVGGCTNHVLAPVVEIVADGTKLWIEFEIAQRGGPV